MVTVLAVTSDTRDPQLGVIVVAGGSSRRMEGADKIFADLGGAPVLAHCLDVFQRSDAVATIVVVLAEHNLGLGRDLIASRRFDKAGTIVTGGARRQDSVRLGLEALAKAGPLPSLIAVHDGPRPFIDEAMIQRALAAVGETGASVPAIPVTDTIKQVDEAGAVVNTPDRSTLRAVQTPQIFRTDLLVAAHGAVDEDVTDDAMLIERNGGAVTVFEGSSDNVKITTPDDLVAARGILASRDVRSAGGSADDALRWGTGFDGHALVPGGGLRLGGVNVPFEMRLEGHSDGDVLLHAIASAILGGAGLGDLGTHFPSSSPEWAGADSRIILRKTAGMASEAGWVVDYLDATIVAEQPRLDPYLVEIASGIAVTLDIDPDRVSVKVTSTDHVGAIGQGEGIAAQAIVTLRAR